jgi:hypothetical protein
LSALVDVQDTEFFGERVEPRAQVRVIEPWPAVQNNYGKSVFPDLRDELAVTVGQLDGQLSAVFSS